VVSQLTYLMVYEKGFKCLLTSHIQVNPPTKLLPIIRIQNAVILSRMKPRVKAKLKHARVKLKNKHPVY
jgi:hypothetical protein